MMTPQGLINTFLDQPLTRPGNRVDAGLQSGGDLTVAPSFAGVRHVGLQQNASFQQKSSRVFALMDQRIQLLSLLAAEIDDVLLYRDLFPGHESVPLSGAESSSQRLAAESRTRGRGRRTTSSNPAWTAVRPCPHREPDCCDRLRI